MPDQTTTKPFVSQAQAGWAFATGQPWAKRWARETGPYKKLPKRKRAKTKACLDCTLAAVKEQLSPGVTRIHGNLCNVHGRYGRCPGASTAAPSKRVPARALPKAPAPKKGRRAAGGKKGGAGRAAKPRQTEAQREQARQAKRQQAQQQRQAEHEENQAKVLHDLGIPEDAAGALADLRAGEAVADDGGLVKMGLAEQGADGSLRLTSTGRALLSAAQAGDAGRARDALGRAADQVASRTERQQAADERKRAADQRKADVEKRRSEAERKRAERLAKKHGGGKGKKQPPPPKPVAAPARAPAPRIAPVRAGSGGGAAHQAPAKPKLDQALTDAVQALSEGKPIDETTEALLVRNGLARRVKGVLVLTAAGQRATRKGASYPDQSQYAGETMEDWDHDQPHRPPSRKAVERARQQFAKAPGIDTATQKSFAVFKDSSGAYRWIARTTTAYRDRDDEILSSESLEADAARMTETRQYGPLRYWHVGQPDPFSMDAPWGPGLDIGDCDFSTVIGRTSIESGTFKSLEIGRAFAETAADHELSPGFFHAPTEPDAAGVYHHIRRFERSVVPIKHGRASNLFTGLTVKEHRMDQATYDQRVKAYLEFAREKGIPPEDAAAPIVAMEQADKDAAERKIAYKEERGGFGAMVRAFLAGDQTTTKEAEAEPPAVEHPPALEPPPDPIMALKAELDALRQEIATLKAGPPASSTAGRWVNAEEMATLKAVADDTTVKLNDDLRAKLVAVVKADATPAAETVVETQADMPMEEMPPEEPVDEGGLTLSSEDLAAMGQLFAQILEPLIGAMGITAKLESGMGELKSLMAGYTKTKDDTQAQLTARLDQAEAALKEIAGDQPRGYRPTQAQDNSSAALLEALKDGPPDGPRNAGPFADLAAQLFPHLMQQ